MAQPEPKPVTGDIQGDTAPYPRKGGREWFDQWLERIHALGASLAGEAGQAESQAAAIGTLYEPVRLHWQSFEKPLALATLGIVSWLLVALPFVLF